MIALLQDVSDTATHIAMPHLNTMLGAALPNVWVMAGITAGLFALMVYLLKVPSEYPLRGTIVAFTTLAFVTSTVVLGIQLWHQVPHQLPNMNNVKADIQGVEHHEVEMQPVGALDTYVPPMPGATSPIRHEQPEVNGLPAGTVWDETTNQSIAQVVGYYADDNNHPGWQVEFSAPNGMVLHRTINTSGGQLQDERLHILARPNVDPHAKNTEIQFELTRRVK